MLVPRPAHRCEGSSTRRLVILGSTGSIGTSALEVVRRHRERFNVVGLAAGSNWEALLAQALEFAPQAVAISDHRAAMALQEAVRDKGLSCEVLEGEDGICRLAAAAECDTVLAAIVGSAGLRPTLTAIEKGKRVALANKESLVVAGDLVVGAARASGSWIVPVDSEHSAIFQALQGVRSEDVSSLILTASGGPFLNMDVSRLSSVTPEQAVRHPRWKMGPKISVDSATLVNKALEVIEASFLFGMEEDRIEVIVHPQSIVHSAVNLRDGSVLAQLSVPDMRGPIAFALSYPDARLRSVMEPLSLTTLARLDFQQLDEERFPAVSVARRCLREGGLMPAVFNFANEEAVSAFVSGRIKFNQIVGLIERILPGWDGKGYSSVDELSRCRAEVRRQAEILIQRGMNA